MTYGNYPDLSLVKRILIIKLRHLGDVLLTTPTISALKRACPGAKIDVYIYDEAKPILEADPDLNQIICNDRSWKKLGLFQKLKKELSLLWNIRKKKYDLVVNLTEGDRGDIVVRFSKASIRVGFEHDHKGFFKKKKLYTHLAKVCGPPRHTVERNIDAVRRIGIFPSFEDRQVRYVIPDTAKSAVKKLLDTHEIENFVLIHPSSRWKFKCWPVAKMRQLIEALILQGKKVVCTAGKDPVEMEMVQKMVQGFDKRLVLNLAGKVNLKELGALIDFSDLLVCVDSLPLHIASALKARVIVLFGPTSSIAWGPWQNPHARVISKKLSCQPCFMDGCGGGKVSDCLERVSVETVLNHCIDKSIQGLGTKLPII